MARIAILLIPLLVALAGTARADAGGTTEASTVALASEGAAEALRLDAERVETLRRRARWLGGLGVASLTLAVGGFTALAFADYPLFEVSATIGGIATVAGAVFFGAWVAMRNELRRAERIGDAEAATRLRIRRRRLLRTGWPMVGTGVLLAIVGVATHGDDDSDAAASAALARTVGLGTAGGALVLVGLPMAIRGHTIRTRARVSVLVGPGSLALAGTF